MTDAKQQLDIYLQAQLARRRRMEDPEYRKTLSEDRKADADVSRTNNLAALLMDSASLAGTLGGKRADASGMARFAQAQNQGMNDFTAQMAAERGDREKRYEMDAKVHEYLARKQQAQEDRDATAQYRKSKLQQDVQIAEAEQKRKEAEGKANRDLEWAKLKQQGELGRARLAADQQKDQQNKALAKTDTEATYRYNVLQQNAKKLRDLLAEHGTTETTGSAGGEMDRLVYEMAIDYAKLVDPDSVAREGEVAAAQKYMLPFRQEFMGIGPKGLGTRNSTASTQIDNYLRALDDRLAARNAAKAGNLVTAGPRNEKPSEGTAIASPEQTIKVIGGKKYKKVEGGWEEMD